MVTVQDRVYDLLSPIVATLDVELLDVEFTGGTLRVTVDSFDADEGITTESLAQVNRLVSPVLDQHDPVPGRYTLEVSSPGLERPLKRAEHYRRAVGEVVVVKLAGSTDPRRVKGVLLRVDGASGSDEADSVDVVIEAVEIDGVVLAEPEERRISTADVATARTVFEWGPSPKPGKSPKGAKNQKDSTKKKSTTRNSNPDRRKGASSEREVRDEQ
jgi:ribosome maturation factor RimP